MKLGLGSSTLSIILETPMDVSFAKHELGAVEIGDKVCCEMIQTEHEGISALVITKMPVADTAAGLEAAEAKRTGKSVTPKPAKKKGGTRKVPN